MQRHFLYITCIFILWVHAFEAFYTHSIYCSPTLLSAQVKNGQSCTSPSPFCLYCMLWGKLCFRCNGTTTMTQCLKLGLLQRHFLHTKLHSYAVFSRFLEIGSSISCTPNFIGTPSFLGLQKQAEAFPVHQTSQLRRLFSVFRNRLKHFLYTKLHRYAVFSRSLEIG